MKRMNGVDRVSEKNKKGKNSKKKTKKNKQTSYLLMNQKKISNRSIKKTNEKKNCVCVFCVSACGCLIN